MRTKKAIVKPNFGTGVMIKARRCETTKQRAVKPNSGSCLANLGQVTQTLAKEGQVSLILVFGNLKALNSQTKAKCLPEKTVLPWCIIALWK